MARFVPSSRVARYAMVGALSFLLGSASLAAAGPVISGWVGIQDGLGNQAKVSAAGELSVRDTRGAVLIAKQTAHIPDGSFPSVVQVETAAFEKIRVYAWNGCSAATSVTWDVSGMDGALNGSLARQTVTGGCSNASPMLIDLPGGRVQIAASPVGGDATVTVWVYGY
jgi:hypothetical protein